MRLTVPGRHNSPKKDDSGMRLTVPDRHNSPKKDDSVNHLTPPIDIIQPTIGKIHIHDFIFNKNWKFAVPILCASVSIFTKHSMNKKS